MVQGLEIHRAGVDRLHHADVPGRKRGFTVFQVVVPFADESVGEPLRFHLVAFLVKGAVYQQPPGRDNLQGGRIAPVLQVPDNLNQH